MFRLLWQKYVFLNDKYPFTTQSVTCGTLYGLGDCIAQKVESYNQKRQKLVAQVENPNQKLIISNKNDEGFDFTRLMRMTTFGSLIDTPILYIWYKFLDKRFTATTLPIVMKKTILDQLICAPIVYVGFFPYLGLLKGHSLDEIKQTMVTCFFSILFFILFYFIFVLETRFCKNLSYGLFCLDSCEFHIVSLCSCKISSCLCFICFPLLECCSIFRWRTGCSYLKLLELFFFCFQSYLVYFFWGFFIYFRSSLTGTNNFPFRIFLPDYNTIFHLFVTTYCNI
jgi:hypothetical protein